MASLLSGREVPLQLVETEFANIRADYANLPRPEWGNLDGLVAIHDFSYSRGQIALDLLGESHKNETPPIRQAVIRTNPTNSRKGFYSGSHASHIEGWPVEEGRALLKDLVANATQPQFTYADK